MKALNLYILLVLTIFFFDPKDTKEMRYLLKRDGFDCPICIDLDDQLNKLNKFPANMSFQTFLLDKGNKVAVLGNPLHNSFNNQPVKAKIKGKVW